MRYSIAHFISIYVIVCTSLPQNEDESSVFPCHLLNDENYSCVPHHRCFIHVCNEDEQRDNSVLSEIFDTPKAPNSDVRSSNPDSKKYCSGISDVLRKTTTGQCEKTATSIRQASIDEESLVCCHKEDILPANRPNSTSKKCTDFAGYRCSALKQCKSDEIITDGSRDVSVRQGFVKFEKGHNKCDSVLEVCCKISDTIDHPEEEAATKKSFKNKCGVHNKDGIDVHISGGEAFTDTQFGEWPHMCFIRRHSGKGFDKVQVYLSGASLIAPGIILTAAHWVYDLNPSDITVICGEWDVKQRIETRDHQERHVEYISIHPSFNDNNLHNDLALLHLSEDFRLAPHINVACLPPSNNFGIDDIIPDKCVATGWGKDSVGDPGEYQVLLQQVKLPFVDHNSCQDMLRQTRLNQTFKLDESFVCAGGRQGEDTCFGDGGGPLVCPLESDPERFVQVGVVSWGIKCGLLNVPGVYTSVMYNLCFIKWATHCREGDRFNDFYDIHGCENWLEMEQTRLEKLKTTYEAIMGSDRFNNVIKDAYSKRLESVVEHLGNVGKMRRQGCSGD